MPKKKKAGDTVPAELKTADYRHTAEKRTNIPPARMAGEGRVPAVPKARYAYSPHLPPTLQFDPTGEPDRLDELLAKATQQPLTAAEATRLRGALRVQEPTLEWAGKREQRAKGFLEVEPVALHIHERVSSRAIIRAALREDVQRDLFADPQQPYQQAVQFYRHDVDWANRLILGDSLQVMSSLARRENLAGKVQMIYMDPPYGIKFASNFQSEIGKRDVKDKDQDLTREPEMVKAYRDTWTLGVHSYLAYLRDRLLVARELLTESGSIFVQISDDNLHRVRAVMDEVFGASNFLRVITVAKTSGMGAQLVSVTQDYLLWYARSEPHVKFHQLYYEKVGKDDAGMYKKQDDQGRVYRIDNLTGQNNNVATCLYELEFQGRRYRTPSSRQWKTNIQGMTRLAHAGRLEASGDGVYYKRYLDDFFVRPITDAWTDTASGGFTDARVYVVQTNVKVVQRCMLMTTEPGDLVLDPTCGSGTTAVTAEEWGRRWITIDTSRVAIGIARQRILTSRFEQFRLRDINPGEPRLSADDPSRGFVYTSVPHVTLKSIAQSSVIEAIARKHQFELDSALASLNSALAVVGDDIRARLKSKLAAKEKQSGKRSVTDADRRRWLVPTTPWQEWEVPIDADPEWPAVLRDAFTVYRSALRAKMDEVNACIAANAEQEELVDQPERVKGVVRVAGPFTVEGVRPEELNFGEDGLFDGTPNAFVHEVEDRVTEAATAGQNLHAYLDQMVRYLRGDGVTFLNNKRRAFSRLEPLYEQGTGGALHAEGVWADATDPEDANVAVAFGPQYGPVTATQVADLIQASRRYNELVIAGFSFDADATAIIQEQSNPRLRIHQAYIRPDVNPGMAGLLKETSNSQLFTVFGTPEVTVSRIAGSDEWTVTLEGVDVYDPVRNEVRSTGADKVAAWFLDSDFDGRCFCITQAFFPNQDAWEKIAKSLGSAADADAFEAFKGTVSIPFPAGTHKRIAVKVIDPRGNEVMAVRALEG